MARDYKPRPQYNKKTSKKGGKPTVANWQWLLVIVLLVSFIAFLAYIRLTGSKQAEPVPAAVTETEKKNAKAAAQKTEAENKEKAAGPKPPHFDFYTVLPEKEVVVPEHEIKTRSREERVGKAKDSKYIMQAGSYGAFKEADQLRAKLALMGIESKVEKAKVGDSVSYRVKMGPYTQMASVDAIKKRLKKSGIDAIVIESGETATKPAAKPTVAPPAATVNKAPATKPALAQPVAVSKTPIAKPVQTQPVAAGKAPAVKPMQTQPTAASKAPIAKPAQSQPATINKNPAVKPTTQNQPAATASKTAPIQPDAENNTVITQPYR